jgi:hypothetical protein
VFKAIPSSATHAAIEASDEGFDAEEEERQYSRAPAAGGNRTVLIGLVFALVAAVAGVIAYGMQASSLSKQVRELQRTAQETQMQAAGSTRVYRTHLVRSKPGSPTLAVGWMKPPQWMDVYVDVSEGKYNQFMITFEKVDSGLVMQLRRVARDSNRELRFTLNSSAFGPGSYMVRVDGYNWRGQTENVGWMMLGLE